MRLKSIILYFLLLFTQFVFAQKSRGDRYLEDYLFEKAIKAYHKHMAIKDSTVLPQLAYAYFLHKDYENAEKYYSRAVAKNYAKSKDYFYYAEVLIINKKYEEGLVQMKKYKRLSRGADTRPSRYLQDDRYFERLLLDIGKYEVSNLEKSNTPFAEFAPAWYIDSTLLITSTGSGVETTKKKQNWDHEVSTDIYQLSKDSSNAYSVKKRMIGNINTKFYDGPVFWHKPTNQFYLTRNDFSNKRGKTDKNNESRQQLYITQLDSLSNTTNFIPFQYNNHQHTIGQASLSDNGQLLFFTMNTSKEVGQGDLYVSKLQDNNTWGEPKKLSRKINTEGNEMFPYYHASGLLFFASDGLPGLGGLDVFVAKIDTATLKVGDVLNMGSPINSEKDDFSLIIDSEGNGFFASNRVGGKGSDDIYAFISKAPVFQTAIVKGQVKSEEGILIPNATIKIINQYYSYETVTDSLGNYEQELEPGINYQLIVSEESFLKQEDQVVLEGTTDEEIVIIKNVTLTKKQRISSSLLAKNRNVELSEVETTHRQLIKSIDTTTFLSKRDTLIARQKSESEISYGSVYFGFNKWQLVSVSNQKLDEVIKEYSKQKGDKKLYCYAHTDCRGTKNYNNYLSAKRLSSVIRYLVSKGIERDKIVGKALGESSPFFNCKCEKEASVQCSESEHQSNRRVEFIIK